MIISMPRTSVHFLYIVVITILALTLAGGTNSAPATQGTSPAPSFIAYHGTLRDSEGKLLNGTPTLTFRIYAGPELGASQLWEEKHSTVTVRDGQFSVLLGDITPLLSEIFLRSPNCFIGVTLAGHEEMQPRQRFTSAPYALAANYALDAKSAAYATQAGQLVDTVFVDKGNVGVGTKQPATRMHVVGGSFRLENDGQQLDIGAGGNNVTLTSDTGDLNIRSPHNVLINTSGEDGTVIIGNNDVVKLQGRFRLNGPNEGLPPVRILRYTNLHNGDDPTFDTRVLADQYYCVAAGYSALFDIAEGDPQAHMVWTYENEGTKTWWVKLAFPSHAAEPEHPDVDIICFHKDFAQWEGGLRTENSAN